MKVIASLIVAVGLVLALLPGTALASATCPSTDQAGFALGQSNLTTDPIFCSYPAVAGEDPNDFFCTYNRNTGALVTDNDAGFCQPSAPGGAPTVNAAPQGADKAVTTNEDTAYTFSVGDFGFSDPNNSPPNSLKAVKITTLPAAGTLADNNAAVTTGQFVPVADITGNKLKFTPAANANGTPYTTFTFQVQDDGGTAGGGVDTDASPNTITVNVTAVNDAPAGTDNAVTTPENTAYTFTVADFGFTDPNDAPPNKLLAVVIASLPASGTLRDNGAVVTLPANILVADISGGKLTFTPGVNGTGAPYTSFTFQVEDDGGTANGGQDIDQSPNTMTINVPQGPMNHAPAGTDNAVTTPENTAYAFTVADFGFTDPNDAPPNKLLAVVFDSLPANGTIRDNGAAVTLPLQILAAEISSGKLTFTPGVNGTGAPYTSFTFQVEDDGGTANGGQDIDQSPNTMTINVPQGPMNHAPAGTDNAVTTPENTAYAFTVADFGFTDPNDAPPNKLLAVVIASLPASGTLRDNGAVVTLPANILVADISGGKLTFTPGVNGTGAPYTSFTFQVEDDGGTANGGQDIDQSPNTMTINVPPPTPPNAAPVNTVPGAQTTPGNTPLVFSTANSNAISIADVDAGSGNLQVTLTLTNGTATLGSTAGLVVSGNGSGTIVATGTLANLNTGLQGLTFTPNNAFVGTATLTVATDDQGNTGTGGPKTDSKTVNIQVGGLPTLSITDVTQNEGNSGTTSFGFVVSLSGPTGVPVMVAYATADGTATAPSDYQATSGTLTFAPGGATSQTVSVSVVGDTTLETNETFAVNLTTPTNATIAKPQGTGTIQNDDLAVSAISLSINDVTVPEGNSGTSNATFTVTLSSPSGQTVTVVAQTADGTATAGSDYTAVGPTTLTFAPGTTTQSFNVPIVGDTANEPNETVLVNLASPTNATIGKAQGVGTIQNDDAPGNAVAITIDDVTVNEGNSGTTPATFTVSLNRVSTAPVTVHYATADATATVADSDYQAASGTLTVNPGELTRTLTINLIGDTKSEPNETFTVNLSSPTNAEIAKAQAIGTIVNDDLAAQTACSTRPAVGVTSRATGDGRLVVILTAGTDGANGANRLVELRFGANVNALIDVAGQTGKSGAFTVPLTDRPTILTFFVRRAAAGATTTVPLTVVDTCGEWPTLVGGGPGAF